MTSTSGMLASVAGADLERVFAALEQAGVRYLVVGGVAVVLHGHPRFTADLDLVIELSSGNARAAMLALEGLGYRPRAPVPASAFADGAIRAQWVSEKGLTVFTLWSPRQPATEIHVFVEEPFDFEAAFARAVHADLGTTRVTVIALEDLIGMKRRVGRPRDLEDIRALEAIARDLKEMSGEGTS